MTLFCSAPLLASAADAPLLINIGPSALKAALQAYALQTHRQLIYTTAVAEGRRTAGVSGRLTPDQALQRLLAGTDIMVEHAGPDVLVLKAGEAEGPRPQHADSISEASVISTAPAAAPPQLDQTQTPSPHILPTKAPIDASPEVSEVVVTGTHIRGVSAIASPTVEVTRDDLDRYGDATIADALDRLPQNFAGTSTPNTSAVGSDRTGSNSGFAQGVNLRGLGANATLVLVDGRRLAGSGLRGDFADVSAMPTAAVDHVEVLLDGASAIYGSDAVGGVVNIITKKDFDGAETTLRYGEDAGGHGPSLQASQTIGLTWNGGHLLAAYEYQRSGDIPASARRYTADSNLTPLGGSNSDTVESSPGNILAYNAAAGAYVSAFAIPAGTGLGLTPSNFVAGATNLSNYRAGTDIMPTQETNGFYLDSAQELDAKTQLSFEGRYNRRSYEDAFSASQTIFDVTKANPYFVSPNGATSELIGYSAIDAIGPSEKTGASKSFDLSIGLDRDFLRTWKLSTYVGFASETNQLLEANELNSAHLNEALGTTPNDPTTSFSTAANGYFNPYGNGAANPKTVLDFIGDGYVRAINADTVTTASLQADGSVITLPGGVVKAAFGAQFRHERFDSSTYVSITAAPIITPGVGYDRDVAAAFGELNIPLVGEANSLPGVRSLTLSIAGRVEHYDDVGTTANPKLGLVWRPIGDVTVHASYGTSFRAPALYELHENSTVEVLSLPSGGSNTLSLVEVGGNTALKPETATSWTAGAEWTPHGIKGLTLGVSWFNVDYTNRISNPGSTALATVLTDPAYASLVTRVSGSDAAQLAEVQSLIAKSTSASASLYPATAYGAIVNAGYINVASLLVSGADLSARYTFDLGENRLGLIGSATYLYNYRQRTTPTATSEQLVSTAGEPVDWRGRATADWARGPFDTALTVNFVDSYWDPTSDRPIGAWITADLTTTWRSPATSGPAKGLVFNAAIQNLLDQDPPFYNAYFGVGYDPANANPLGRVVSVQLSKRW